MSLADQVRSLELLRERGDLTEAQFQLKVADLLRAVTAASEETIVDAAGQAIGSEIQGGPPPAHLGAYELMELLGQGGMGSVYLAKHLLKPGLFAVKVPRKDFLRRPGFGHHFKKEAGVGLKLDHPGIVRVLDLIIDGEWAAIVMQFVAGPNLEEVLQNNGGPLHSTRVVELMVQVLDAMDYAHEAGVLHRDLKPKNLLLHPSGRVKVTDFGVAGLIGMEESQVGTMLGTAPYMAPELYTGAARIDQRTDIYALGMTLYKLLVGRLPFHGDLNPYQVLRAKEEGRVPLPGDLGVHVSHHLVEVIFRALRPDPVDRFPSCAAFKQALTAGPRRQSVVPALVTSGPQTIPPIGTVRLEHRVDGESGVSSSRLSGTLSSLPTLEQEARMSTGTLVLLIFVTSLLAAVIALGVSGNLGQLTLAPSPPGADSRDGEVQRVATQRSEDEGAPQASQESDAATQTSPQRLSSPAQEPAKGTTARDKEPRASSTKRAQRRKKKSRRARSQKKQTSSLPNQGDESARGSLGGTEGTNEYTPSDLSASSDEDNGTQISAPSLDVVPSANIGNELTAPPSPEAVTPTQPEGPAMGFLYLSAQPECEVSIDGKSYGTTKKTNKGLILREGAYKVRFVCHDEALCAQFNKRAGVKTLKVYADRATRYEANFYRLNE